MASVAFDNEMTTSVRNSEIDAIHRVGTSLSMLPVRVSRPVEWQIFDGLSPYEETVAAMEARVEGIASGKSSEAVFLLEHSPLYTGGTSAKDGDLIDARFPVYRTGRGGQFTYHGPGQRVAYVMLDLTRRRQDVRAFVGALESWIIATLADFNIKGETREGRVGLWVERPEKPRGINGEMAEDKIAAIGVRLRRWVSFHGIAINVDPDLSHFSGIVPCGVAASHLGVTSFADLGHRVSFADVDGALLRSFETIFGETIAAK